MRYQEKSASEEKGVSRKDWGGRFPVALGYPNTYPLAMSNLGFQTIYHLLNRDPRIVAERFCLEPGANGPPLTRESRRPLTDAGLLLFSISFESDYLNLVTLLTQAGLAPQARKRGNESPLILVGGVTTFINPLPLFSLVDGFLLGEGEIQIPILIEVLLERQGADRRSLLPALRAVPGFLEASLPVQGQVRLPRAEVDSLVPRTFVAGSGPQVFTDSLLLEVNRGCPRGCRFCAAGFVYRPFRNRSLSCLQESVVAGQELGYRRVGLVGSALGDYPELQELCRWLGEQNLEFSFSSLRIDVVNDALLELMRRGGVKAITIAPEAGSERLRRALRKGLSEELILAQAERVAAAGIGRLKLYFIIGLPGESRDDIEAIVDLVDKIRKRMLAARSRKQLNVSLNVSINPFIPKPQTPLQWAPFASLTELEDKEKFLLQRLRRLGGVELEMENPLKGAWQAQLSRGGVEMGAALVELAGSSGRLKNNLKKIVHDYQSSLAGFDPDRPLPWEFITQATPKKVLRHEFDAYWQTLYSGS
ncbi:MAG: radical SAM protein [Deltaproteobacteria bacterium]|nr:radical SAM protein [Deltaproteobacteria bacterium]